MLKETIIKSKIVSAPKLGLGVKTFLFSHPILALGCAWAVKACLVYAGYKWFVNAKMKHRTMCRENNI